MGSHIKWWAHICCIAVVLAVSCAGPDKLQDLVPSIPSDESLLRVGISADAPPLIFKVDNQIVGLEADFARELADYLDRRPVFVELKWKDLIPALEDNRIDVIMSGMTATDVRRMRISFTEPYFLSGQMPMIRSVDALKYVTLLQTGRIGYVKGTTGENFTEKYFPGTQSMGFSVPEDGVKALINKKIDVMIHDGPIILYLASKYDSNGVRPVYSVLTEEYLAWGVRRDDAALRDEANSFLDKIKNDGQLNAIIRRWIPLVR